MSARSGDVDDHALRALDAPKMIWRNLYSDVEEVSAAARQGFAQRPPDSPERHGVDTGAVARTKPGSQMRIANRDRVDESLFGEDEDRLRVTLPEWAGFLQSSQKVQAHAASRHRSVDHQRIRRLCGLHRLSQRRVHKSPKAIKLGAAKRDSRRHCVTAAFLDKAKLNALPNRAANIDTT
jgi:hypothetical protein